MMKKAAKFQFTVSGKVSRKPTKTKLNSTKLLNNFFYFQFTVIKCKNLMKVNESGQVNAYVKCALTNLKSLASQASYQRTAVHKSSLHPIFDHKFEFEMNLNDDEQKFFQIAVWHRNKNLR